MTLEFFGQSRAWVFNQKSSPLGENGLECCARNSPLQKELSRSSSGRLWALIMTTSLFALAKGIFIVRNVLTRGDLSSNLLLRITVEADIIICSQTGKLCVLLADG